MLEEAEEAFPGLFLRPSPHRIRLADCVCRLTTQGGWDSQWQTMISVMWKDMDVTSGGDEGNGGDRFISYQLLGDVMIITWQVENYYNSTFLDRRPNQFQVISKAMCRGVGGMSLASFGCPPCERCMDGYQC